MRLALALLPLLVAADLDGLLRAGKFRQAVEQATPAALLTATAKLERAGGVINEVVRQRGPFRDPAKGAAWLVELARARDRDPDALTSAAYLYLRAGDADAAVRTVESIPAKARSGIAYAYLADAERRLGRGKEAEQALREAARRSPGSKFVQDIALKMAATRRTKGDRTYADLLEAVGLSLRAALWLVEDIEYAATGRDALRKRALAMFKRGLDDSAPATAFWAAAQLADGDTRYGYLLEAVRRGEVPSGDQDHACPGAILALARECAKRKRLVAAAALAKKRLNVGECTAAWELLESLPAHLAR